MKILVVDDSKIMRNIHRNTLKEHGLTDDNFFDAEDGAVALKIAKEQNVDLFLVDWNMPNLNGLDFVKEIRAMSQYAETPVIMITSEAAKYNVVEAIDAGVTNYVVKPIQARILWEKLSKYIK